MSKPGWEPRQCDDGPKPLIRAVPAHITQTRFSPEISTLYSPGLSSLNSF